MRHGQCKKGGEVTRGCCPACRLHVVPIPTRALQQVGFASHSLQARATPTAQGHFLLLHFLLFSLQQDPTLLLKAVFPLPKDFPTPLRRDTYPPYLVTSQTGNLDPEGLGR